MLHTGEIFESSNACLGVGSQRSKRKPSRRTFRCCMRFILGNYILQLAQIGLKSYRSAHQVQDRYLARVKTILTSQDTKAKYEKRHEYEICNFKKHGTCAYKYRQACMYICVCNTYVKIKITANSPARKFYKNLQVI